jgi:hypothetical protein
MLSDVVPQSAAEAAGLEPGLPQSANTVRVDSSSTNCA